MLILPKNDVKKQEVLEQVASKFEEGKEYTEAEVNDIIKACDTEDHVLFRRELWNFGYFGKDSYRGVYWIKTKKLSGEQLEKIKENQREIRKPSQKGGL